MSAAGWRLSANCGGTGRMFESCRAHFSVSARVTSRTRAGSPNAPSKATKASEGPRRSGAHGAAAAAADARAPPRARWPLQHRARGATGRIRDSWHRRDSRPAERLRPAAVDGDGRRIGCTPRALRAVARPRRSPLHGPLQDHGEAGPEEGDARPRPRLGREHDDQHDRACADRRDERQRQARTHARPDQGRRLVPALHAVPGQPDERWPTFPERGAPRRRRAHRDHSPDRDGVSLMDLVLRAVFMFAFIYAIPRLIGRRDLSSLEPFDLILLIVLGDAIQQGLTQDDYSVTGAVLVIGTLALLQVFTSVLSFKVPRL